MKTKILKSVFPLAAIVLAVGGAFAFNGAPERNAVIDVNGYIPGSTCEETEIVCQTDNNGIVCTDDSSVELYRLNPAGTACPNPLYRKP